MLMKKKLTLSIEEDVIEFAHELSNKNNQSISNMIENYFITLKEQKNNNNEDKLSKEVKEITGFFDEDKLPKDKKEMRKIFHEKSID